MPALQAEERVLALGLPPVRGAARGGDAGVT
jgi:hypothetical protein